MIGAHVVIQDD